MNDDNEVGSYILNTATGCVAYVPSLSDTTNKSFLGFYTDRGDRVSLTSPIFSQNTTVYAHWNTIIQREDLTGVFNSNFFQYAGYKNGITSYTSDYLISMIDGVLTFHDGVGTSIDQYILSNFYLNQYLLEAANEYGCKFISFYIPRYSEFDDGEAESYLVSNPFGSSNYPGPQLSNFNSSGCDIDSSYCYGIGNSFNEVYFNSTDFYGSEEVETAIGGDFVFNDRISSIIKTYDSILNIHDIYLGDCPYRAATGRFTYYDTDLVGENRIHIFDNLAERLIKGEDSTFICLTPEEDESLPSFILYYHNDYINDSLAFLIEEVGPDNQDSNYTYCFDNGFSTELRNFTAYGVYPLEILAGKIDGDFEIDRN